MCNSTVRSRYGPERIKRGSEFVSNLFIALIGTTSPLDGTGAPEAVARDSRRNMINRRVSLTMAAIFGVGLAFGATAKAQTIVQTFTIPNGTSTSTVIPPFVFNLFPAADGALFLVTLNLQAQITAEVDVVNIDNVNHTFNNATASIPVSASALNLTVGTTAVAGPVAGTALASSITPFPGLTTNANTSSSVNTPVALALWYTPPGTATGLMSATGGNGTYTGTQTDGSGKLFFGGQAVYGETLTLTYFYAAAGTIPEPGAATFLAAGVLGSLGIMLRRRRKVA
jgi:hypothetical protein